MRPADDAETGALDPRLLTWLGLPPQATAADARAAHAAVSAHLAAAPAVLAPWAAREAAAADAVLARLTGDIAPDAELGLAPDADEDARADARRSPARAAAPRRRPLLLHPAVIVALIAGVVFGVYRMGLPAPATDAAPHPGASATAMPGMAPTPEPVDPAQVTTLEAKVKADPRNVTAMQSLGDMYYRARDFDRAATWQAKVAALAPTSTDAQLRYGAALFGKGDTAGAQRAWNTTIKLDPKNVEAYYNLGFLHLSSSPPNEAAARTAWTKVIDLEPSSRLATTVKSHLDRLSSRSAHPTASPSGTTK